MVVLMTPDPAPDGWVKPAVRRQPTVCALRSQTAAVMLFQSEEENADRVIASSFGEARMKAVPLSGAVGAELTDFDINREYTPEEAIELRRLFREHHLLLVRGQELTPDSHDRFVLAFGPLQEDRVGEAAGFVTNQEHPKSLFGKESFRLLWHTDGAYGARPGIATSLWAIQISETATPTQVANAVEIVHRLPAELRDKVERYRVVNVRDRAFDRTYERVPREELVATDDPDRYVTYEHGVLFDPPHLEAKAIIASEQMTSYVVDVSAEESDAFLDELFAHLYAPDNIYIHHWQPNDVIIWDNIALHHGRPGPIDLGTPRHMRRQCIDGWWTDEGGLIEWKFARARVRADAM
jgi:taurine dioxygenase